MGIVAPEYSLVVNKSEGSELKALLEFLRGHVTADDDKSAIYRLLKEIEDIGELRKGCKFRQCLLTKREAKFLDSVLESFDIDLDFPELRGM